MEPKFQTSFIPKKPIGSGGGSASMVVRPINIFSLIATILFIVTIIVSGGLFVYKKVIEGQIVQANKAIDEARDALELNKIKELLDANSRIMASKNLLDKHIAASRILTHLEELTVKRMRLSELSYTNNASLIDLTLKAEVQTYNALGQQEYIFSQDEFFRKPQFSNISLTENGVITVDFSAKIDPTLVSYKKAIETEPLTQ